MATLYSEIYERAILKFSDYDWMSLNEDVREKILHAYLLSAENDFVHICHEDLTNKDDDLMQYNETLSNESKEILALGVAYYWVSSKAMDSRLLKNVLSTKDFTVHSPANLVNAVNSLMTAIGKTYHKAIIDYSYRNGKIATIGEANEQ